MASISTGGGGGGKKSLDSEIPLVPFIDLLLCCVMFLLVTAVWNQLSRINANQKTPGQAQTQLPQEEKEKLYLTIRDSGYRIYSTNGTEELVDKSGDSYDLETLQEKLRERKKVDPNREDIIVTADDGIEYMYIVEAMDIAIGEGYKDLSLTDTAPI